jgi:hypothetical protein
MAEILASALNIDMSGPKTYENLFRKQKEINCEINVRYEKRRMDRSLRRERKTCEEVTRFAGWRPTWC